MVKEKETDGIIPISGQTQASTAIDFKSVALALGLSESATPEELTKAITEMVAKNESLESAINLSDGVKIRTLIDAAYKAHKITDSDRDHYLKLAADDYDGTKEILDAIEPPKFQNEL